MSSICDDSTDMGKGFNAKGNSTALKLVVLGKSLVGKSALTYRFISDKFPTEHDTTVEDQYKTIMSVNGINYELEVLDTAGQDDYQTMLDTWIDFGNCFLLVYSIDDYDSFKQIKEKFERIQQLKNSGTYSVVIVGNKCDLGDTSRKVEKSEAENYARNIGFSAIEVSALTKINVKEDFRQVVLDYLEKNKKGITKCVICPCF